MEEQLDALKPTVNRMIKYVERFNENFITLAKSKSFDKKVISRKFRDFMVLTDKIKDVSEAFELDDATIKVKDWIEKAAEEFEK